MNTDKKKPIPADDKVEVNKDRQSALAAHDEAEADIDKDPDMELPTPNDDLDEGELANLGGDKNDLI